MKRYRGGCKAEDLGVGTSGEKKKKGGVRGAEAVTGRKGLCFEKNRGAFEQRRR